MPPAPATAPGAADPAFALPSAMNAEELARVWLLVAAFAPCVRSAVAPAIGLPEGACTR